MNCFSAHARSEIKKHIEQVMARLKLPCDVKWDELWDSLELAALAYDPSAVESGAGASETIKKLDQYRSTIDDLLKNCLQKRELFEFDFVSATGVFTKRKRKPPASLIKELTTLRDEFDKDIAELKKFSGGGKTHSASKDDYRIPVQGLILELGGKILGPSVGNENGPLVTFMRLALHPILGKDTPTAQSLRKFAQRKWGGHQGQK